MSCNKYSLLNICGFLKAGPRKNFSFKLVRSAKNVADPWVMPLLDNLSMVQPLLHTGSAWRSFQQLQW